MAELDVTQMRLDIDELQAKRPYYTLGLGTEIPAGADLNNYTTPGVYATYSGANTKTLINKPNDSTISGDAAIVTVHNAGNNWLVQNFTDSLTGVTYHRRNVAGNWTAWYCNDGIDSIVAEGTTNGWRWIKYAGGFATCWRYLEGTMTIAQLTGAIYRGVISVSLPFQFVQLPSPHAEANDTNSWATAVHVASNNSLTVCMFAGNARSAYLGGFRIFVMGEWK